MKKKIFAAVLLGVSAAGFICAEQLFEKSKLKTWDRENVAGGKGTLFGKFSFTRNDAKADQAIKEIGWMTLKPGASIGLHKHETNEDAYIIISGEGTFTDSAGTAYPVKAGDITIARKGESHALANTGKKDLVFLDVIAEK
jgi:mannose-6-phosphate isomerase-like protein (cupin superfamily)